MAISFREYLQLYKASWLKLQQTSPRVSGYEDRQLYSTWQLSLDHIRQQHEPSAKLLQLWAYFDNRDLWFELLREANPDGPEWLCQLTEDQLSFTQAVRMLCDYGLVEVHNSSDRDEIESKGYSMHSCVYSWATYQLNKEWDTGMATIAVDCVNRHWPDRKESNTPKARATVERLWQHAGKGWQYYIESKLDESRDYQSLFGNIPQTFSG